jgi:hypothetical protein
LAYFDNKIEYYKEVVNSDSSNTFVNKIIKITKL